MMVEMRRMQELDYEARLRAELDRRAALTPAMLHCIDDKGRIVAVSDAWLEKMGYARQEVIGRASVDFLTPESRARAQKEVLPEFFRSGRVENVQYQMARKDGRIIDVILSGVLDEDPAGRGRVSVAVMTDVTALNDAKRQLADSEARYRSLVEDQSEMVSLARVDGILLYVNHAYASFYGRRPEEMIGKNLFDFVPEEGRALLAAHLQRVCEAGRSLQAENQVMMPDGERRWFSWSNLALRDSEGRVTSIHSVGRDVDEQLTAERRVEESEARYRFLAENCTDLIVLVGRNGKRTYVSPACRWMLGYEPGEMLAMRSRDAVHPDDADRVMKILAVGSTEKTHRYRMRRKDGSYLWVESTGRAVEIPGQEHQRLVVTRDIGQRVEAEEKLRDSEARYRLLADNSTDMVFQLDSELVRRYVSPACLEILGYEPDELIGVKPTDMAHPEDAARLELTLKSLMTGHSDRLSLVSRVRHRDGRWVWVEAHLRALKDPDTGKPTGVIGALRDISVRKAIEDELADANRRLQALVGEDGLTRLANRRAFDEALAKEYRRAKRDNNNLGLVMIDVDRFKPFNDCYGHPAGDDCLRRIARAIRETVQRPGDLAARYGGEEYAVLLPGADEAACATIAERIRDRVARLNITHAASATGSVTISAGAASVTPAISDYGPDALVRGADRALYRAKDAGRNLVMRASALAPSGSENPSAAA
jgi:diguanylate cyclase (GGDEF)-like protein/PAS domain S-box-containing protein